MHEPAWDPTNSDAHPDAHAIAGYLEKRLPPSRLATLEAHLAACGDCRREVVELASIFRGRSRARFSQVSVGALGLAVAAVLVLVVLPQSRTPRGAPTAGDSPPVPPALSNLGAVARPAAYLGVSVRAASAPQDSLFDSAMVAYNAGDYSTSRELLEAARRAGRRDAATAFFLGSALLMLGDALNAEDEFALVSGMPSSPYDAEAYYYRAKAALRLGRASDAIIALDAAANSGVPPVDEMASSLRDSVRSVYPP